jgi:hypothetical protein
MPENLRAAGKAMDRVLNRFYHHHSTTNELGNWLRRATTGAIFATTPLPGT